MKNLCLPILSSSALALAAIAIGSGPAAAAVDVLTLSGDVANGTYSGTASTGWSYALDLGLGSSSPFDINVGDEIQATITLDGPLTVPNGPIQFVGLAFNGSPAETNPAVTGSFTFSGGSNISSAPLGANCGNCLTNLYSQFDGGGFSFTSVYVDTFIAALDPAPYQVTDVQLNFYVYPVTAAPEPAAWALMLVGLGAAGAALRSRRRNAAVPV